MTAKKPTGLAARLAGKTQDIAKNPSARSIADRPPVTMPGQLGAFRIEAQRYQQQIQNLQEQLDDADQRPTQIDLPLDKLVTVEGRRRRLTAEEFAQLRENLRENALIEPIIVRRIDDEKFEVITGHNRVAAFRELARDTIPGIVRDLDPVRADINAFYSNLLHPDLTDFEKYLGFKMISEHEGLITSEALAERTGHSARQIRRLMMFDALPDEAIKLLDEFPGMIGASAAEALAKLTAEGKGAEVFSALKSAAAGEITEAQAIAMATASKKPARKKQPPTTIKSGATIYCRIHAAEKVLRLEFASPEQRETAQAAVAEVLEKMKS